MAVAATHYLWSKHSLWSKYREALLEQLLIGELMRAVWLYGDRPLEVAKPQVDAAGYDLILQIGGTVRHVQLKTSHHRARARSVPIQTSLMDHEGACVVWTLFRAEDLHPAKFLWFGSGPGQPVPNIHNLKIAKHTKAGAQGVKAKRPGIRLLPRSCFEVCDDVYGLLDRLFGRWR